MLRKIAKLGSNRLLFIGSRVFSAEAYASVSAPHGVSNEPILDYRPGSKERQVLDASIQKLSSTITDVPIVIGDEEIRLGAEKFQVSPFDHSKKIAKFHHAPANVIQRAIDVGLQARVEWEATPLEKRAEVFEKAANLLIGKYRADINAATMLGQGKNSIQAEIDAACELIDFLRFNNAFAMKLLEYQPISPVNSGVINTMRYRGLEGFVAAISPFNFTAIGGNLASAPALMGNTVMWKPSDTAVLSNWIVFQVLREAGLPAGVINFLPSDGPTFGNAIVHDSNLADRKSVV